jgi:sugar lactone lactonase YvrE
MTAPGLPGPGELNAGKVVRIDSNGSQTTIVDQLSFPTAMTFGPDGALYVSNFGFGGPPGAGQILRIVVPR